MNNEQLVALIQAGNRELLAELWGQVERFVSMQAGRQARALGGFGGTTAEDLYQSGYLALVAAVGSYDPSGCSFISWLAIALKTAFAEASGYRSTRRDALEYSASLDMPVDDEGGTTLGELQEDPYATQTMEDAEHNIWREQLRAALDKAMADLPAEQSDTLRRRYYNGRSLAQTAAEVGVFPETVRQRERKALRALGRRRELLQFVELRTNYFLHVSAKTCERTTEVIAIRREELAQKWLAKG